MFYQVLFAMNTIEFLSSRLRVYIDLTVVSSNNTNIAGTTGFYA